MAETRERWYTETRFSRIFMDCLSVRIRSPEKGAAVR